VVVDIVGELDESEALPEGAADLPGEVRGVDREQCPPTPGRGVNGMNPNGSVDAAEIASQMSMSRSWANIASSLTWATLTWRKVFSSSFVSSATAVEVTGTVRSTSRA